MILGTIVHAEIVSYMEVAIRGRFLTNLYLTIYGNMVQCFWVLPKVVGG